MNNRTYLQTMHSISADLESIGERDMARTVDKAHRILLKVYKKGGLLGSRFKAKKKKKLTEVNCPPLRRSRYEIAKSNVSR